jgi:hypothetical protein
VTTPQAQKSKTLPIKLLEFSKSLLPSDSQRGRPDPAKLRRSISTAYYAVFSLLFEAGASTIGGPGSQNKALRGTLARLFQHSEMHEASAGFANSNPAERWKQCLGNQPIFQDLATVTAKFRDLQQARHEADYDILKKQKSPTLSSQLTMQFKHLTRGSM